MSNDERGRLSQINTLTMLRRDYKLTDMLTVYLSDVSDGYNHGIHCALIRARDIDKVLLNYSWDFHYGDGHPGSVIYYPEEEKVVEYLRYGSIEHIEPLVINRCFHGIRADYEEISEEFRLFHELYEDKKTNTFYKMDNSGEMHKVAIIKPNLVEIRLKEICQFLAVKEMYLSVQFDYKEYSHSSLKNLGFSEKSSENRENLFSWSLYCGEMNGVSEYSSFSVLVGKRLFSPLPKSKSGFFGFDEIEKKYAKFIIGLDKVGDQIEFEANPDALANYFGANPNAPHYLTPVCFRRDVLDRYYQKPSRYSVENSYLRCGGLWGMQIDNHHEDKIYVWLGDLGRIPYDDQLHWRVHNIPPVGNLSDAFFANQILANPTDSSHPDHLFTRSYDNLKKVCEEKLGWPLLLPLRTEDSYHFQTLRIPSTEEQREFDELVLSLTKVLIDSINEKKLKEIIPNQSDGSNISGINLLERVLQHTGVEGFSSYISYLRKLQALRSSSVAHRKGKNYEKMSSDLGIGSKNFRTVFVELLEGGTRYLDFLASVANDRLFHSPGK